MKNIVMGIIAHVDAGKTTLSEALLYVSGTRRTLGRVDHKDAFLDTHDLERARGITIFSKQAEVELEKTSITFNFFLQNRIQTATVYKFPKNKSNIQVYGIYSPIFSKLKTNSK